VPIELFAASAENEVALDLLRRLGILEAGSPAVVPVAAADTARGPV